jgi:hypothetical protein
MSNLRLRSISLFATLTVLITTLLLNTPLAAQDDTATPAPTKTPTTEPTVAATPADDAEPVVSDPFTQSDLTVLTGNVQRPNGLTWLDGILYVACTGDFTIYEINAEDGRTLTYAGGVRNAHALYAEMGDDDIPVVWAGDFGQNTLTRTIRGRTEVITEDLNGPWGITYLDDEHFLLTSLFGNSLLRLTREGDVQPLLTDLASPTGVIMDDERIYIGNNGSTRRAIEWYPRDLVENDDSLAAADAEGGALVSGLQNVTGLATDSEGRLYFAYSLGTRGVVGRVDPAACAEQGGCGNADVEIVVYTELTAPLAGLTISPDDRLYVHTIFAPEIYWVGL